MQFAAGLGVSWLRDNLDNGLVGPALDDRSIVAVHKFCAYEQSCTAAIQKRRATGQQKSESSILSWDTDRKFAMAIRICSGNGGTRACLSFRAINRVAIGAIVGTHILIMKWLIKFRLVYGLHRNWNVWGESYCGKRKILNSRGEVVSWMEKWEIYKTSHTWMFTFTFNSVTNTLKNICTVVIIIVII